MIFFLRVLAALWREEKKFCHKKHKMHNQGNFSINYGFGSILPFNTPELIEMLLIKELKRDKFDF
ncbi:MAG: hypothetical protein DRH24_15505 [Deltaproteobacteria bacterium]|nr:MAG: hypothetical protein DRH24_15505 [Deltaproteobacteria bacterium]